MNIMWSIRVFLTMSNIEFHEASFLSIVSPVFRCGILTRSLKIVDGFCYKKQTEKLVLCSLLRTRWSTFRGKSQRAGDHRHRFILGGVYFFCQGCWAAVVEVTVCLRGVCVRACTRMRTQRRSPTRTPQSRASRFTSMSRFFVCPPLPKRTGNCQGEARTKANTPDATSTSS